jgi:hypothetical protein
MFNSAVPAADPTAHRLATIHREWPAAARTKPP